MRSLRSYIVLVTTSWAISRLPTSRSSSAWGMMPSTSPPSASAASATVPMRPTAPPP